MKFIKKIRIQFYVWLFNCLPIKKNRIFMWSNSFKNYACNPKYLTEYLLKSKYDYDIVWGFSDFDKIPDDFPKEIRTVKYFSIRYLYEIATAQILVGNARTAGHYYLKKRKNQVYIQTWHSSLRLKMIEKDAENELPMSYIQNAKEDSKKIDYIISGCEFSSKIFKNSFWYNGKIFESGTPRIDFLLNNNDKINTKVRNKLFIEKNAMVVLYAPTFRNGNLLDVYNIDYNRLINKFENKYHKKCYILIKYHPNLQNENIKMEESQTIKNVTCYNDIQELIVCSDILITDYSSCMFDCAYIKKPCMLYMPDYDKYVSCERKLYFDIEKLPFLKAKTLEELDEIIDEFSEKDYQKSVDKFLALINSYETGHACQQIEELIQQYVGCKIKKEC